MSNQSEPVSFHDQFIRCEAEGFHGVGPEVEIDPIFPNQKIHDFVKANGCLPKLRGIACLRFGGQCHSHHEQCQKLRGLGLAPLNPVIIDPPAERAIALCDRLNRDRRFNDDKFDIMKNLTETRATIGEQNVKGEFPLTPENVVTAIEEGSLNTVRRLQQDLESACAGWIAAEVNLEIAKERDAETKVLSTKLAVANTLIEILEEHIDDIEQRRDADAGRLCDLILNVDTEKVALKAEIDRKEKIIRNLQMRNRTLTDSTRFINLICSP